MFSLKKKPSNPETKKNDPLPTNGDVIQKEETSNPPKKEDEDISDTKEPIHVKSSTSQKIRESPESPPPTPPSPPPIAQVVDDNGNESENDAIESVKVDKGSRPRRAPISLKKQQVVEAAKNIREKRAESVKAPTKTKSEDKAKDIPKNVTKEKRKVEESPISKKKAREAAAYFINGESKSKKDADEDEDDEDEEEGGGKDREVDSSKVRESEEPHESGKETASCSEDEEKVTKNAVKKRNRTDDLQVIMECDKYGFKPDNCKETIFIYKVEYQGKDGKIRTGQYLTKSDYQLAFGKIPSVPKTLEFPLVSIHHSANGNHKTKKSVQAIHIEDIKSIISKSKNKDPDAVKARDSFFEHLRAVEEIIAEKKGETTKKDVSAKKIQKKAEPISVSTKPKTTDAAGSGYIPPPLFDEAGLVAMVKRVVHVAINDLRVEMIRKYDKDIATLKKDLKKEMEDEIDKKLQEDEGEEEEGGEEEEEEDDDFESPKKKAKSG